jgi:hypothetical protein
MKENRELLLLLVPLKERIAKSFKSGDWMDLGALTGSLSEIENHSRLLRSLGFGDDDYEGYILPILRDMVARDPNNLNAITRYLNMKYPETEGGENISSHESSGRRIYFTPDVFKVPEDGVNPKQVSVMMPFDASFSPTYTAIQQACADTGMDCVRADNIWEQSVLVQDIFALIFRSFIVVCDFSTKNPNVFYEAGIAHTLGKHVIPITQSADDIPFDLRHHRFLKYLPNIEGRKVLSTELAKRLRTLFGGATDSDFEPIPF